MNSGHGPDLASARFRAEFLRKLRDFFFHREVLEVETPILSRGISLDRHIDVFSAAFYSLGYLRPSADSSTFFLQTSPEPHMKRLLCAGFPDIYQISKAFRNGEVGHQHNPEFSMLEWYRKGYSLIQLMDEVASLCLNLMGPRPVAKFTYREVFMRAFQIDPVEIDLPALLGLPILQNHLPAGHTFSTKSDALEYLMAHLIEPGFSPEALTFVYEFPSEQAAQAQLLTENPNLAHRFEVYGGGMELGNGYLELLDPSIYDKRFDQENAKRRILGKPELPKDQTLLSALRVGLPPCSGVAMGLDRLLMLAMHKVDIKSVLNFPWESC